MTRNQSRRYTNLFFIILALYFVSIAIVLIVIGSTNSDFSAVPYLFTRVLLPIIVFPLSAFIGILINNYKVKKQQQSLKSDYDYLIDDEENIPNETSEPQLVFNPIIFKGDKEIKYCQICQKQVKDGQVILICPFCKSTFHHEHLLDWLKDNPLCPICNTDI